MLRACSIIDIRRHFHFREQMNEQSKVNTRRDMEDKG
jgi:hypothetical protein